MGLLQGWLDVGAMGILLTRPEIGLHKKVNSIFQASLRHWTRRIRDTLKKMRRVQPNSHFLPLRLI